MKKIVVIIAIVVAMMLSACTSSPPQPTKTPSITVEPATTNEEVKQTTSEDGGMTNDEMAEQPIMIDNTPQEFEENIQGEHLLLDVRTQGEYDEGHIEGSTLIPVNELEGRLDEISEYKNLPVLVYCRSGNRSVTASNILLENGFTDVHNLLGGIRAWNNYKQ
jgi:rhodanese-related sulfurtransferase